MPSLMDVSNNLICINGMNNSLLELNKGVFTYEKINRIHTNNCIGKDGTTLVKDYTLYDISFANAYRPTQPFSDTCQNLQNILATCDNAISTESIQKNSEITTEFNTYVNSYKNQLYSNYGNVISYRKNLDQSALKIMGLDNSLYEKQNMTDSAVFTTLLWTALATSVLYYAFTKL